MRLKVWITVNYKHLCSIPLRLRGRFEEFVRKITVRLLRSCLLKHKAFYTSIFNLYKVEFYIILKVVDDLVVVRHIRNGFRVCISQDYTIGKINLYEILSGIDYGSRLTGRPRRYIRDLFLFVNRNLSKFALNFVGANTGAYGGYNERLSI